MKICTESEISNSCDLFLIENQKINFDDLSLFLESTFPHMKKNIPTWISYIASHGENMVIIDKEKKIQGFLNIEKKSNTLSEINFIGVSPQIQKKGIGTFLLNYAEQKNKNNNMSVQELRLHTEGDHMNNLQFYHKNNWKIYNVDKNGYSHTTAVEYRKKISSK